MSDVQNRQLAALAGLVQLEKRVRAAATLEELAFLMVNDTHMMVGYRQAALWRCDQGRMQALSGLAAPDPDAPFTVWFGRIVRARLTRKDAATVHVFTAHDLDPVEHGMWQEHLPQHILWLPLLPPAGKAGPAANGPMALLLLGRDDPWQEPEQKLLDYVIDAYAHAWASLGGVRRRGASKSMVVARVAVVLAVLAGAMALPVPQSVLAPAEIVAHEPTIIRVPVQGVIEDVLVRPNQMVTEGTVLARLDPRELLNRQEIARQSLGIADAELRQARQQAMFDERAKANLAILQGRREQAAAELAYLDEVLQRLVITAPRDGIVILDDAGEWIGKPVALGERILMLADPNDAELDIFLAVSDAITLETGAPIRFFLNIDPAAPLSAELIRAGYRAAPTPEGILAYRLKGQFLEPDARIRVGLKGTVRIQGAPTRLFFYLFRRPLASLRLLLGM
jgi:hypothetical protein